VQITQGIRLTGLSRTYPWGKTGGVCPGKNTLRALSESRGYLSVVGPAEA